jgi:DNA polymerase III epsilon subunit family exonuclease
LAYRIPDFRHEALLRLSELLEQHSSCTALEAARTVFRSQSVPESLAQNLIEALVKEDNRFYQDENGDWSLRAPVHLGNLLDLTYVVLDVETTGGQPPAHRITELGAVRVRKGQIHDEFCTLINPERQIPLDITRLTGITNAMVAGKPTALEIFPEFADWVGDAVIVAHNATFDKRFIDAQWRDVFGMATPNTWLCSVRIARKLYPGLRSRSLGPLCVALGIEIGRQHRAGDDARATAEVLLREFSDLAARGISSWEGLMGITKPITPTLPKPRRPIHYGAPDAV